MILTTTLIDTTVLRAFCALGAKTSKYYAALGMGKNGLCLFKELSLLRVYIDILRDFKIIGSTIPCHCCIEGDYKVTLPNDKIYYFQFGCDNIGYLLTEDNGGYDFTYFYDEINHQLVMSYDVDYSYQSYFNLTSGAGVVAYSVYLNGVLIYLNENIEYTDFIEDFNSTNVYGYSLTANGSLTILTEGGFYTNDDIEILENDSVFNPILGMIDEGPLIIIFEDVDFTEECNFTYSGVFPWYYNSELDVTGTPILTTNGLITIQDPLGVNIVTPLVIPGALLATPQDVVDYWNTNRASTNFTLSYNGSEYVMESPADFVNYYSHTFNFVQYESVNVPVGGTNATASYVNITTGAGNQNSIIKAYVNALEIGSYTIVGTETIQQVANNLESTFIYAGTSSVTGNTINLIAPVVGTAYNGTPFEIKITEPEVLPSFFFIITNVGSLNQQVRVTINGVGLLGNATVTAGITTLQLSTSLINDINSSTPTHGFTAQLLNGNEIHITAPVGSGAFYSGVSGQILNLQSAPPGPTLIETIYNSTIIDGSRTIILGSGLDPQSRTIYSTTFLGGTNSGVIPQDQFVTYTSNFDVIVDDELTYENLDPCVPEVVVQTCLSNNDIIKIINNVNKIIQ